MNLSQSVALQRFPPSSKLFIAVAERKTVEPTVAGASWDSQLSFGANQETVNGVVTLTGVLDSDVAVKKAIAAAKSVEGVKEVDGSGLKSK